MNEHPSPNVNFFGRQNVLEQLDRKLDPRSMGPHRMLLWGLPGSGKTAITLKYLQSYGKSYATSIWINAASKQAMQESLVEVAEEIAPEQASRTGAKPHLLMTRWLQRNLEPWLLIIDSLDEDQGLDVRQIVPNCAHGSVLITSRHSKSESLRNFADIEITQLDQEAAVSLLCSRLKPGILQNQAQKRAASIVTALHGLPLAIEQAGIALKYGCSFQRLQDMVQDKDSLPRLLNEKPRKKDWIYDKNQTIYAILDELRTRLGQEDELASAVLAWVAVLGPGTIPRHALVPFANNSKAKLSFSRLSDRLSEDRVVTPALIPSLEIAASEPATFWRTVTLMESFCLLKARRSSQNELVSVSLHDTVRQWIIARFEQTELEALVLFTIETMSSRFIGCEDNGLTSLLRSKLRLPARNIVAFFFRHMRLQSVSNQTLRLSRIWHDSFREFAKQLISMRLYKEAQDILTHIIDCKLASEQGWSTNETTLSILEDQADCYSGSGYLKDAERAYTDLLEHFPKTADITTRIHSKLEEVNRMIRLSHGSFMSYIPSTEVCSKPSMAGIAAGTPEPPELQDSRSDYCPGLSEWLEEKIPCDTATLEDMAIIQSLKRYYILIVIHHTHDTQDSEVSWRDLSRLKMDYYRRKDFWRAAAYTTIEWSLNSKFARSTSRYCAWSGTPQTSFSTVTTAQDLVFEILLHSFEEPSEAVTELNVLCLVYCHSDALLFELLMQDADLSRESLQWLLSQTSSLHEEGAAMPIEPLLLRAVSIMDIPGQTIDQLLHYSVKFDQVEVARLLLERGVDARELDQSRLFEMAIRAGSDEVTGLLKTMHFDASYDPIISLLPMERSNLFLQAVQLGKTNILRFLLAHDNALVHVQIENMTCLMYASKTGQIEAVRLWLDSGSDPHVIDNAGRTSLMYASESGHADVVELLLNRGADPNNTVHNGMTPLMRAIELGCTAVAKLLLENGSDVSVRNQDGLTAPQLACRQGCLDIIEVFLRYDAVLCSQQDLVNSLLRASLAGRLDLIELLRDLTAQSVVADNHGATASLRSPCNDHDETFAPLSNRDTGMDEEVEYLERRPLLFQEIFDGSPRLVRTLLNTGANANSADRFTGLQALVYAAIKGCFKSVALLLESGAVTRVANEHRLRPLLDQSGGSFDYPCEDQHQEFLDQNSNDGFMDDFFVFPASAATRHDVPTSAPGRKAMPDLIRRDFYMPLFAAVIGARFADERLQQSRSHRSVGCGFVPNHDEVIRLLVEAGANPDVKNGVDSTTDERISNDQKFERVKMLLAQKTDLNTRAEGHEVFVQEAMRNEEHAIVELLLDVAVGGITKLMYSSSLGQVERVKALLHEGAEPNAISGDGYTALMCALQSDDHCLEITSLLLDGGADPDTAKEDGETFVEMALAECRPDVVMLLEERGFKPLSTDD